MGKYRLTLDIQAEELEKTNLFRYPGSCRDKLVIDIEAKYAYEAVDIFKQYLTAGMSNKTFIPIKLGEEYIIASKDAKDIIASEVATDEDVD